MHALSELSKKLKYAPYTACTNSDYINERVGLLFLYNTATNDSANKITTINRLYNAISFVKQSYDLKKGIYVTN